MKVIHCTNFSIVKTHCRFDQKREHSNLFQTSFFFHFFLALFEDFLNLGRFIFVRTSNLDAYINLIDCLEQFFFINVFNI